MLSEASYHNMTVGRIPSVEGGIQPTLLTTKGDIIVATGDATLVRQGVGAHGTVLTANSAQADGVEWAAGPGMTLIKRAAFSAVSNTGTTFDSQFTTTYETYMVVMAVKGSVAGALFRFQARRGSSTVAATYYGSSNELNFVGTAATKLNNNTAQLDITNLDTTNNFNLCMTVTGVGTGNSENSYISGNYFQPSSVSTGNFGGSIPPGLNDGFILSAASGTITGQVAIYGLAK